MWTGLEVAHCDPWSLILRILYQFNGWCKIGTYVSFFCKSFIIPRWLVLCFDNLIPWPLFADNSWQAAKNKAFSSWNLCFPHWLNDHCQLTLNRKKPFCPTVFAVAWKELKTQKRKNKMRVKSNWRETLCVAAAHTMGHLCLHFYIPEQNAGLRAPHIFNQKDNDSSPGFTSSEFSEVSNSWSAACLWSGLSLRPLCSPWPYVSYHLTLESRGHNAVADPFPPHPPFGFCRDLQEGTPAKGWAKKYYEGNRIPVIWMMKITMEKSERGW